MKKKRTNHVVTMHKHRLFEYHIVYPETKIAYDSFGMNIFISVNYKENIYNEFIYDGLKNISKYILIAKKLVEKCFIGPLEKNMEYYFKKKHLFLSLKKNINTVLMNLIGFHLKNIRSLIQ